MSAKPGKTLVFCFDGTGNEPSDVGGFQEDESITNVLKLHILMGGGLEGHAPSQNARRRSAAQLLLQRHRHAGGRAAHTAARPPVLRRALEAEHGVRADLGRRPPHPRRGARRFREGRLPARRHPRAVRLQPRRGTGAQVRKPDPRRTRGVPRFVPRRFRHRGRDERRPPFRRQAQQRRGVRERHAECAHRAGGSPAGHRRGSRRLLADADQQRRGASRAHRGGLAARRSRRRGRRLLARRPVRQRPGIHDRRNAGRRSGATSSSARKAMSRGCWPPSKARWRTFSWTTWRSIR